MPTTVGILTFMGRKNSILCLSEPEKKTEFLQYFYTHEHLTIHTQLSWGWSGGAKVLGKLPVPGRPANLAYSRARTYCAFSRCG